MMSWPQQSPLCNNFIGRTKDVMTVEVYAATATIIVRRGRGRRTRIKSRCGLATSVFESYTVPNSVKLPLRQSSVRSATQVMPVEIDRISSPAVIPGGCLFAAASKRRSCVYTSVAKLDVV
eukprot:TRINITY_DN87_c0_g1_i21.p2 TRINITY_DN87_c0_g1~~TRINITY_DN87_c0_g1_i21.p2  ORF type:complete len:121 (+),score=4.18 TRINITY_DN87_c0_g1_i21:176-538(+)